MDRPDLPAQVAAPFLAIFCPWRWGWIADFREEVRDLLRESDVRSLEARGIDRAVLFDTGVLRRTVVVRPPTEPPTVNPVPPPSPRSTR